MAGRITLSRKDTKKVHPGRERPGRFCLIAFVFPARDQIKVGKYG